MMASQAPPLPVTFQRKPSSRASTGKTNKQSFTADVPAEKTSRPQAYEKEELRTTRGEDGEKLLPRLGLLSRG
eukprot:1536616-Rhodomonas_salina.1